MHYTPRTLCVQGTPVQVRVAATTTNAALNLEADVGTGIASSSRGNGGGGSSSSSRRSSSTSITRSSRSPMDDGEDTENSLNSPDNPKTPKKLYKPNQPNSEKFGSTTHGHNGEEILVSKREYGE